MQLEDNLEREKKQRADVEKAKRKLENDLKMTQETVDELERVKRDLEDNIRRWAQHNLTYVTLQSWFQLVFTSNVCKVQAKFLNVCRKDNEVNKLNSQLEDEQSLVAQLQKKIKELLVSGLTSFKIAE